MQKRQKIQTLILGACSFVALSMTMAGCAPAPHFNGFIDKKGTLVFDIDRLKDKPLAIGDYSESLAVVKYKDGYGCWNKAGEVTFKHPFRKLMPFSEGLAAFSVGKSDADEKWGYIDKNGETIIKPTFTAADRFSDEAAAVRLATQANGGKAGQWAYIDKTGKQIIKETYQEAQPFHEGLAPVKVNDKMGCINRIGQFVVPPNFDVVYAADHGMIAAAQGKGLSGPNPAQNVEYFSKDGVTSGHCNFPGITLENLKPMMWAKIPAPKGDPDRPLSVFVSPGFHEDKSIQQAGTKFVVPQQFAARAFAGSFDYMYPVSEGFFVAYSDANGGKVDYRGGVPEDANGIWNNRGYRFWDAAPFSNGLGLVQETKKGNYGYVDKTGSYAIQPTFDHARPFKDDRALVGPSALLNP